MKEAEERPKPACFKGVGDKVGISPMPLAPLPAPETALAPLLSGAVGLSRPCRHLPLNGPVNRASGGPCSVSGKDRHLTGV